MSVLLLIYFIALYALKAIDFTALIIYKPVEFAMPSKSLFSLV